MWWQQDADVQRTCAWKEATTQALSGKLDLEFAAWERLWTQRKRLHVYRNVVEAAERHLSSLRGASVLEVGCGRGATILEFAKRGARATGLDYAESALAFSRELQVLAPSAEKCTFTRGDARQLPFESEVFDVVYSVGLLEHFEEPRYLLAEQQRVLKAGGIIIFQVPQTYSLYTIIKKLLIAVGKWPYGVWETQYDEAELIMLAERAGFIASYTAGYGSFTLALLRHFLFPRLAFDLGHHNGARRGLAHWIRTHSSMDIYLVGYKNGNQSQNKR